MKRRQVLGGAATVGGLGALAYLLPKSCQPSDTIEEIDGGEVADFDTYYDIWRQLTERLHQSPDHPTGQANALVEKGDPEAITAFVRDRIALLSSEGYRFAMGNTSTFGSRAALRAGAGTAFEKAQILADLLTKTGRKAEVVKCSKVARTEIAKVFFRDFEQEFAPPISNAEGRAWRKALGEIQSETVGTIGDENEIQAIADKMLTTLADTKSKFAAARWDNRQVGDTPMVKVTEEDGSISYADPIRTSGGYGPLPEGVKTGKVFVENEKKQMVSVSLEFSRSSTPTEYETAHSASWSFHEIAGRQLRMGFTPGTDAMAVYASRFQDLRSFVPSFSIQDLDGGLDSTPEKRHSVGPMLTLGGQLVSEKDGEVLIDGISVVSKTSAKAKNRVAVVRSLTGKVNPSCFPELRLSLTPRDASGKIVGGLLPADISIKEKGSPVGFSLHSNQPAPRVMILADGSLSMPKSFRGGGAKMTALIESVKAKALARFPASRIDVKTTNSSMWTHLTRASKEEYNLIIYATDGDLDGKSPDEEMLTVLRNGPRALIMNVNNNLEALRAKHPKNIFDEMAKATGGDAFDVSPDDLAAAEAKLDKILLAEAELDPYLLSYAAPHRESGDHQAEVTIGSQKVLLNYTVPETASLPKQVASLRLRVKVGKFEQVRHIAGWQDFGEVTQTHLDEVYGAFFGTHILAFEGPPPPASVIMEEVLMTKLALEPLEQMITSKVKTEALIAALEMGLPSLPGKLASLMGRTAPICGSDYASGQLGLRTILYSFFPVMDSDRTVERVDIIPLEKAFILAETQETRLKQSLRRSIPLSLAEKSLFSISALGLMEGKEWIPLHRRSYRDFDLTQEKKDQWYYFLEEQRLRFPHPGGANVGVKNGEHVVALAIDYATGEFSSFLEDGSGGGREEAAIREQLRKLDQVIAGLNLLVGVVSAAGAVSAGGAVALGIVAAYGQQLARLYAAVSMTIILLDPSHIDKATRRFIAAMACEVLKALVLGAFSNAGRIGGKAVDRFGSTVKNLEKAAGDFSNIDNATNLMSEKNPFSCPSTF